MIGERSSCNDVDCGIVDSYGNVGRSRVVGKSRTLLDPKASVVTGSVL